jgi:hypothetical protein
MALIPITKPRKNKGKIMTFSWRIASSEFMDEVEIDRFNKVVDLLKIDYGAVIDSYSMSPDGPKLSSIFLINNDYIVEIGMNQKHLIFDFSPALLLINYRIKFDEHVTSADVPSNSEESASVFSENISEISSESHKNTRFVTLTFRHSDILVTHLSYFGADLEEWLQFALEAYPKTNLL